MRVARGIALQVVIGTILTLAIGFLVFLAMDASASVAVEATIRYVLIFVDIALVTWLVLLIVGGVRRRGIGWGVRGSIAAAGLGALMNLVWIVLLSVINGGFDPVDADDINRYVREQTGGDFSAKDFRTLHGTVTAAISLAKAGPRPTPTARKRVVAQVMRDVAAALGNTPAVARASYVDPRIVDHYDRGRTIDPAKTGSAETQVRVLLFN